ncbi:MAG: hypothetical protein U0270_36435 [Labilithrix sp.]
MTKRWGMGVGVIVVGLSLAEAACDDSTTSTPAPTGDAGADGATADTNVDAGAEAGPTDPCGASVPASCLQRCGREACQEPACGGAEICAEVTLRYKGDGSYVDEPGALPALKCMVEAYRDGKVGYFKWTSYNADNLPGQFTDHQIVEILAGRRSVATTNALYDLDERHQRWSGQTLAEPAVFTACLEKGTFQDLATCVRSAFPTICR